jgi:two-component system, OmpR family, KDP operon response regulator KdpE
MTANSPPHAPLALVIEDEEPIRRFLRATLESHNFRVKESCSAKDGLLDARTQRPDLILLDLGLPDGDGIAVAREVRSWSPVPILVISARGQENDKIAALDAGADDYVTKPFAVGELMARVRVAMRNAARGKDAGAPKAYESRAGDRSLRVDLVGRRVHVIDAHGEREIRLTPTEFQLLALLVRQAGRVLTHQQILKEVWGPTHARDVQYLRVYAGQLRQKLETDPAQPRFLITEPGVGYRLVAETAPPSSSQ